MRVRRLRLDVVSVKGIRDVGGFTGGRLPAIAGTTVG